MIRAGRQGQHRYRINKFVELLLRSEDPAVQAYVDQGVVVDVTDADRANESLLLFGSEKDLNYAMLSPTVLKACMSSTKINCSYEYLRRLDGAIKWGARQRGVALPEEHAPEIASWLESYNDEEEADPISRELYERIVSFASRGDWTLGRILDVYWQFSRTGDECLASQFLRNAMGDAQEENN
jgi:hypothetical protein